MGFPLGQPLLPSILNWWPFFIQCVAGPFPSSRGRALAHLSRDPCASLRHQPLHARGACRHGCRGSLRLFGKGLTNKLLALPGDLQRHGKVSQQRIARFYLLCCSTSAHDDTAQATTNLLLMETLFCGSALKRGSLFRYRTKI